MSYLIDFFSRYLKVKETVQETSLEKPETSKQDEKKVGETAKISALEDELAKLRAQIAMIVSAQQAGIDFYSTLTSRS